MANRLPIPGGDNGDWGDILNSFLEVSLYNDPNNSSDSNNGTLNSGVVGTAQIANNAVTNAQLDVPTQTTLAAVASKYTKPSPGIPNTDLTSSVQTSLGLANTSVQIGGDIGGTTSSPVVSKINGVTMPGGAPSSGQVIQATGASATNWATISSTTVSDATSSTKGIIQLDGDLGGTAASPVVSTIGGHTPITTVTTLTGGDLSGTLPAPTVAKVNGVAVTGTPSSGQVITASSSSAAAWTTPAAGAGNATSGTTGLIQLDGDLGGTATSPTVAKVNGVTLPASAPASGNVLTATSASATAWTTPAAGVSLDSTAGDIQPLGSQSAGSSSLAAKADHVHPTTGLITTTTSLSGDVTGTASSTTVAKVNGVAVTGTPSASQVLTATSASAAQWTTPAAGAGNATSSTPGLVELAGDLSGTATSPVVATSNGVAIATTSGTQALTNKNLTSGTNTFPTFNQNTTGNAATATLASTVTTNANLTGDVTSIGNATTVAKLQGTTLSAPTGGATSYLNANGTWTTPTAGAQLLVSTAVKTSAYTASPGDFIPVDTSGGNVTITLPTAPANNTRVEIKMINTAVNVTNGYGNNVVTFTAGGSDVFNKASGATTGYLTILNQAIMLQYSASPAIWYVQSDDLPQSSVPLGLSHTVTTTYTMTATDHVVMADATSAAFTITLPTAVGYSGVYNIEAITSTANIVTLNTTSSQTIEGASTTSLGTNASGALYSSVTLVSDGANWRIL